VGSPNLAELRRKASAGENPTTFAIELADTLVGLIEYHEENEPDYRHAGIDIFLSESVHGRGLGTDGVATLARYLIHERGHHRLTIDPAVENTAAVRCYEKVGFRAVGVMREYSRAPTTLAGRAVDGSARIRAPPSSQRRVAAARLALDRRSGSLGAALRPRSGPLRRASAAACGRRARS